MCPLCTWMSKSGKVLKAHIICNNSHNKPGRHKQFTPEVTLIGTHIVSKFSQIQPLLPKLSTILYMATSFKTISFQEHCVVNCIKIKPYGTFLCLFPFKTITFSLILVQWHQDSSYSNHPCLTGLQTTSRQHSRNGRVISHSHWKPPTFPQKDVMPAS